MPKINHEILTWARESFGLTIEEAAKRLILKDSNNSSGVEKLGEYENGKKEPTRPILLKMSKLYQKPLLMFYLERPPKKGNRGEDFRTLNNKVNPKDNAYIDVLIRNVKARQSLLRDTLLDEDEAIRLNYIGSANMKQSVSKIATDISKTLAFNLDQFRSNENIDGAFRYLRELAEQVGMYVLLIGNLGSHHTNIDAQTFRGFVLADEFAPFVIINDLDAKVAWSFTLLHEIAHLWLGQTGISGASDENKAEKFCNEIASEILLPSAEVANFSPNLLDFDALARDISKFAQARNISSQLVCYRLYQIGTLDKGIWNKLNSFYTKSWLENQKKEKEKNKQKEGGPDYFIIRRQKLGRSIVRFAKRMIQSGALTTTRAGLLLGIKPLKVQKLLE